MSMNANKINDAQRIKEILVDRKDQSSVFSDNKLSWQNIILTQEKWANTDNSWRSIIALILMLLGIVFAISFIMNLFY